MAFYERRRLCRELYPSLSSDAEKDCAQGNAGAPFHFEGDGPHRTHAAAVLDLAGVDWRNDLGKLPLVPEQPHNAAAPPSWPHTDAPFTVTHVLTDRGSCFTADGFEGLCHELKAQHRTTRPYTPKTNGMVERFHGRAPRKVVGIMIHRHADLETLLKGFNRTYNARRQRVLRGLSSDEAVRQRMKANPKLASKSYQPPSDPCVLPKAILAIAAAKEGSHPDS